MSPAEQLPRLVGRRAARGAPIGRGTSQRPQKRTRLDCLGFGEGTTYGAWRDTDLTAAAQLVAGRSYSRRPSALVDSAHRISGMIHWGASPRATRAMFS
jgi:hypothetical protein